MSISSSDRSRSRSRERKTSSSRGHHHITVEKPPDLREDIVITTVDIGSPVTAATMAVAAPPTEIQITGPEVEIGVPEVVVRHPSGSPAWESPETDANVFIDLPPGDRSKRVVITPRRIDQ